MIDETELNQYETDDMLVTLPGEEEVKRQQLHAVARLLISVVAQAATLFTWSFNTDAATTFVITIVDLVILVHFLWWKNNNMTVAAVAGQQVTDEVKQGLKDVSE